MHHSLNYAHHSALSSSIRACAGGGAFEKLIDQIIRYLRVVPKMLCFLDRIPKEITVSNIHQAICNIPFLDFLTNKHMGILNEDQ